MSKTWISTFGFCLLMLTTVVWAAPVPDTGQTKCYNATVEIPCPSPGQPFYGQDANYTINPMSYTKLDDSGNALPDSASVLGYGAGQCHRPDLGDENQHGWGPKLQRSSRCG